MQQVKQTPNFGTAQFLISAAKMIQCPTDEGAEVAFAGRSNAGKSSAINCLTNQRSLARTSKTPGRTQLINFFSMSDQSRLVDLPGYGFAKVPLALQRAWEATMIEYLNERKSLKGLILVMDIRHPLQNYDMNFVNWSQEKGISLHAILTKSDKLKRGAAKNQLLSVEKAFREHDPELRTLSVQTFSSLKKDGKETLAAKLGQWLSPK